MTHGCSTNSLTFLLPGIWEEWKINYRIFVVVFSVRWWDPSLSQGSVSDRRKACRVEVLKCYGPLAGRLYLNLSISSLST
jgi:hypothetical protein